MAWTELIEKRGTTSRTYADGNKRSFHTVLKTRLHYESALDSGVLDAEIDATPVRVDTAAFDGWRVETMGWHYALGRDLLNHGNEDGWVGFGGRKGAHWFKYRLNRVGYIHGPTRDWQDIGGLATYNRLNLSQQTDALTIGPNGDEIVVQAHATWANLWATPGGGSIGISWHVEGRGLKEEIKVNQAAREWIAANRPPTTPIDETWFSFLFRLDWSDIPRIVRAGILQSADDDFADDGERIELRDALDRVLALMPLDTVSVPGTDEGAPIRKRFYSDGGNHFLVIGVRCDTLVGLPAGDLVFDPTFTDGYGGDVDTACDTWIYSGKPTYNNGARDRFAIAGSGSTLIRFDLSAIPADATFNSATLTLTSLTTSKTVSNEAHRVLEANGDWIEGATNYAQAAAGEPCWDAKEADGSGGVTTAWAGSAGCGTSGTDYEASALGSYSDTIGDYGDEVMSLADISDWFGFSPNSGMILIRTDDQDVLAASSEYATTGDRPALVVEYTAAGGATYTLTADAGSLELAGQDAGLTAARVLTADAGAFEFTGYDAGLYRGYTLAADAGNVELTGQDASLLVSRQLAADTGALELTGHDAGLIASRLLSADTGALELTGHDASLLVSRLLNAEAGTLTFTGRDATLTYTPIGGPTYTLTADAGTFTLTGQDAGLIVSRLLSAEAGAVVLTGHDAEIVHGYVLTAEAGSLELTGNDAALVLGRVLQAETGTLELTGYDVTFLYSGAPAVVTPDSRIFVIAAEDRVYVIVAEDRIDAIAAEDRTYVINA